MSSDKSIRETISSMVDQEHDLRDKLSRHEISAADEQAQLKHLEAELDQCWDLLRQRDADREFHKNPDTAQVRSEKVVENYLD